MRLTLTSEVFTITTMTTVRATQVCYALGNSQKSQCSKFWKILPRLLQTIPHKLALQGWSGGGRQHPVPSCQVTAHGKKANSFLPLFVYEAIFNIWVRVI